MDTSNVIAVSNGIVTLSNCEIDLVSGGKSVVQKIWESIANWFDGLGSQPSTSGPINATPEQIRDLQESCLNSGGDFTFSAGTATTGLTFSLAGVDGSVSWFNVQCTH